MTEALPRERVLVLNGPNLGRLGTREPEIYGTGTHADLVASCVETGIGLGLDVEVRQTDSESELIGWLHEAADNALPVVLNAAALTHYSISLHDAVAMLTAPCVEVHLSQPAAREAFRHHSVISAVVTGTVSGLGVEGYRAALRAIAALPEPGAEALTGPNAAPLA